MYIYFLTLYFMSEAMPVNSPKKSLNEFGRVEELWKEWEASGNYALYLRALDDYLLQAFVFPLNQESSELSNTIDAMAEKLRPLIFDGDDSYTENISRKTLEESWFSLENVKHMLGKDSIKTITNHNALLRDVMLSMDKKETRQ
jgi:hypothetical protein